jgi:hypothetical protein
MGVSPKKSVVNMVKVIEWMKPAMAGPFKSASGLKKIIDTYDTEKILSISPKIIKNLNKLLEADKEIFDRVVHASAACAGLLGWVTAIL